MMASGSSVGSADSPLPLLEQAVLLGSHGRDALQVIAAVAAAWDVALLLHVLEDQLAARRLHLADPVAGRAEGVTPAISQTLNHREEEKRRSRAQHRRDDVTTARQR
jgi:hypothetical protein